MQAYGASKEKCKTQILCCRCECCSSVKRSSGGEAFERFEHEHKYCNITPESFAKDSCKSGIVVVIFLLLVSLNLPRIKKNCIMLPSVVFYLCLPGIPKASHRWVISSHDKMNRCNKQRSSSRLSRCFSERAGMCCLHLEAAHPCR